MNIEEARSGMNEVYYKAEVWCFILSVHTRQRMIKESRVNSGGRGNR